MQNFFVSLLKIILFPIIQQSFFSKKKKSDKEAKILVLGLDNAGKTTILKAISGEIAQNLPPTKGFNAKVLQKGLVKFTFWDVGGQKAIRSLWENYYESNDALIYVIDSSDTYRLEESGQELRSLLEENQLSGIPLLIFANKQDLNLSLSPEEIMNDLNLTNIINRKWTIVASSGVNRSGLKEGLDWLEKQICY